MDPTTLVEAPTVDNAWSSYLILVTSSLAIVLVAGLTFRVLSYKKVVAEWRRMFPVFEFPLSPTSPLANIPPYSMFFPTINFGWSERLKTYKDSEIVGVSGVLQGETLLWTNSPEVIRQITGNKAPFSKPPSATMVIEIMGRNVVSTSGEEWKLHRKVAAPAFSHEAQVWEETVRTFREMSSGEGWDGRDAVNVQNMTLYTRKLALFIIASCGFNIPLSWADGDVDKDGRMSLRAVLATVASSLIVRWLTPKWAYYLPIKRLQRIDTAYTHLDSFLDGQIRNRKTEIKSESEVDTDSAETKRDIFSRFVASSLNEGKLGLGDQEIIGNTFITLFAGHETTAHSLAVTLILLGLYEDEQARVYNHIVEVVGDRTPTFDDYEALESIVLSAVYESIRLYPPIYLMIRQADKDTSFTAPKADGSGHIDVFMPKGMQIVMDIIGLSYNPRMYPDASSFKPSRFDGVHDTSPAFSYGPRICLGKKFATTEMVCFLTLMLRDWEIKIARNVGETREQWRERILRPALDVAMLMPPLPLKLVRRS